MVRYEARWRASPQANKTGQVTAPLIEPTRRSGAVAFPLTGCHVTDVRWLFPLPAAMLPTEMARFGGILAGLY
jgi:hypothetical protein